MADPKPPPSFRPAVGLLLLALLAIAISVAFNRCLPDGFDPVAIEGYPFAASVDVPVRNGSLLAASERIGEGLLPGPEDLAYDAGEGYIYTGCSDGWVRRVRVADGRVEDWVRVGGRPLGLMIDRRDGSLIVAESDKGLLIVKRDKSIELLTDEAEGLKFGLTDGVDVASDGMIYFTDATFKYRFGEDMLDILGGRPNGRLMSFDPATKQTVVLLRNLYFANGVSLSPDQQSLIFCETVLRRCKRYHIQGERKGSVEIFVDNFPGFPDNVRYDGEGCYWIALASGRTLMWDMVMKYPFLRKLRVAWEKFMLVPHALRRDSGVLSVSLEGKPIALYSDPNLYVVTGGLRIGKHLYYGSLIEPYIGKINLTEDGEITNPP